MTINGHYSTYDGFYQQCVGESIFLSCESIVLPDDASIVSIQWKLGGAEIPEATQTTLEFNSGIASVNEITVEILSSLGCTATFALDMPILYLEAREITIDQTIGTCLQEGAPVEVSFDLADISNLFLINELIALPDYTNSTQSSIFISGYDNQSIESCTDLSSVFINIEHSYIGDLDISLTCPNGSMVDLLSFPEFSSNGNYFGEPSTSEADVLPGIGYDYYWSENASSTIDQSISSFPGSASIPSGTYRPDDSFCAFIGCPINGEWILKIVDNVAMDNGNIFSWGLNFPTSTQLVYDNTSSGFNSFEWSSSEFLFENTSITNATVLPNGNDLGIINYQFTNTAGCVSNASKQFHFTDFNVTLNAGDDILFSDFYPVLTTSSLELDNQQCYGQTFETSICYGNNEYQFYTFCASDYFDCSSHPVLSVIGQMEITDLLTIWDGTDTLSNPIYSGHVDLNENGEYLERFILMNDCATIRIITDESISCVGFNNPLQIELRSNPTPNPIFSWTPQDIFETPDSLSSFVNFPIEDTWATLTMDLPLYSGCSDLDSLFITIPDNTVLISIFFDENMNSIMDDGELRVPYIPVQTNTLGTFYSNENGQIYSNIQEPTTFELYLENSIWQATTPTSIEINSIDGEGIIEEFFFGITPNNNFDVDVEVSIEGITPNCNTISYASISVFNEGGFFPGGELAVNIDPLYTILQTSASVISQLNNTIVFNIPTLFAHEQFEIDLTLQNPAETAFGQVTTHNAVCFYNQGSGTLSDPIDEESLEMEIVCAYDPNNKITHTGEGDFNDIEPNTTLEYTINFQNIGNAEAQNVIITDEISDLFVVSSLQPVAWSHDFDLHIENNLAVFTFYNIYLPGIEQDEQASQGFVRFRINQIENLPPATIIENSANIYFDNNDPIFTNVALNRIAIPDNVNENSLENYYLFPNPTKGLVYWNNADLELILVLSAMGERVPFNLTPADQQVDLTALSSGVYILEFKNKAGRVWRQKLIKH